MTAGVDLFSSFFLRTSGWVSAPFDREMHSPGQSHCLVIELKCKPPGHTWLDILPSWQNKYIEHFAGWGNLTMPFIGHLGSCAFFGKL
jgi:hypothetical protein